MRQENTDPHRTQKREAVRGILLFALLQLASAVILVWAAGIPGVPGWLSRALWVIALADVLAILPSGIVLKQRLEEIEGGEQDEAGKY